MLAHGAWELRVTPTVVAMPKSEFDRDLFLFGVDDVVAMTEMARRHELWEPLVLLASKLTAFLWHGSHWTDLERVYQCVLEAGTHTGNPDSNRNSRKALSNDSSPVSGTTVPFASVTISMRRVSIT